MIKYLTRREIFDKAYNGILEQGKFSVNTKGCRYRTEDGAKCAAGHLLLDDYYNNCFEGITVRFHARNHNDTSLQMALENSGIQKDNFPLVMKLQAIHDKYALEYYNKVSALRQDNSLVEKEKAILEEYMSSWKKEMEQKSLFLEEVFDGVYS